MAIAFKAAGSNTTYTAVTTVTLVKPIGSAFGDLLLGFFGSTGASRASQPSITPPAGWTTVKVQQDATNFGDLSIFWANGNVSNLAFTIGNGANVSGNCFCLNWTGVDTTTPIDVAAGGQNNVSGTTETAPSITTVSANAMLVGGFLWNDSASGALPAYSLEFGTHRMNAGLVAGRGGSTSVDAVELSQAVAGASGAKTITVSIAKVSEGILLALRPLVAATFHGDEDFWAPYVAEPDESVVTIWG